MLMPLAAKRDRPFAFSYSIYKPRLYFTITAADCATCMRYDFMRTVKHLKICLTIDTQTSAAIAPLQYTYHRYFSPYTHISHSTDYAIASLFSRSHAGIDLIGTVTGDLEFLRCTGTVTRHTSFLFVSSPFMLRFCREAAAESQESLAQTVEICDGVSYRRN